MADLDYGSDPITIEVLFQTPEEELLTSVFVKREGHDPKEEEMLEMSRRMNVVREPERNDRGMCFPGERLC
jgi:hypothetical protein